VTEKRTEFQESVEQFPAWARNPNRHTNGVLRPCGRSRGICTRYAMRRIERG